MANELMFNNYPNAIQRLHIRTYSTAIILKAVLSHHVYFMSAITPTLFSM